MKLSDYVIDFLIEKEVKHLFLLVGGSCAHLVDSLFQKKMEIEPICVQHEQAAAFAAEGYARMSQGVGVAMATSGPGATNLITGIGSAFFDSIPCLFLTGQVNTYDFSGESPQRQRGFQETDIVNIVKPITKYAALVDDPASIRYHLEKGFSMATRGRPGPVLIDLPMDVQRADISPESLNGYREDGEIAAFNEKSLAISVGKTASLLNGAKRPVILVGGGVRIARAAKWLRRLVQLTQIPVVVTYAGKDAFPNDHPSYAGFIGNYGHRCGNFTVANADVLLVLGSRLDTRTTGSSPQLFAREATIIQVEIDPYELNQRVKCQHPVLADLRVFLEYLVQELGESPSLDIAEWLGRVNSFKSQFPWFPREHKPSDSQVDPYVFMEALSEELGEDDIVVADMGQTRVWALQMLSVREEQRFFTSVGMAPMGYGLPAAIGASFAWPGRRVVCLAGDGGIQLNIQELQTVFFHQLPVKIFIINNASYGMVKQFQQFYFDGRVFGTGEGYSCPDFSRIAESYGIPTATLQDTSDIRQGIRSILDEEGPFLANIIIPSDTSVIPKVRVNHPIEDAEPLLDREEFLANMVIPPYLDSE
jgi:acetolactate synthase I/II/III large subunit